MLFDGDSANVAGRDVVESKVAIGRVSVDHAENAQDASLGREDKL